MSVAELFDPAPGTVYLDSATYGLPPRPTVEVMRQALTDWQAGTADWIRDWDVAGEVCRTRFAELIGAAADSVALVPSASTGVGTIVASLREGDEVIVPDDEFTSVLYPLLVAERASGIDVRRVALDELAAQVRASTRLVAFSLIQMQSGRAADLPAILAAAERVGARTLVDATHAVPFVPLDTGRIDYLVCAAYKHLLCPRGVAFLYVRADRQDEVAPILANWRSSSDPYGRYAGGSLDLAAGAARFDVSLGWLPWLGASVSLDLLTVWRRQGVIEDARRLARRLAARLGLAEPLSAVVGVPVGDAEAVRTSLSEQGIRAAVRVGSVRLSTHVYNTVDEVDRAAQALSSFVRLPTAA